MLVRLHMQHIPTNWGQLFNLATKMYNGLVLFALAIPVTMVTAAQMLASKTAFKNAGDSFNAARSNVNSAYQVSNPAQKALYKWLVATRSVLALQLGKRWSPAWAAAGFVGPTTKIPDTVEGRIALGNALETYLTDNPERERPDDDVTAAKAGEMTGAAITAQQGVTTAEQALKAAGDVREPAKADLLKLISSVIANLDKKLAKDDPRWLAFGLQLPSMQTTPAAPTGLRATIMGTQVLLENDAMPLATRYRYRGKIVGLDTQYKLLASRVDPMAVLEGVAAGITLEIIAQAVNGGSQSVASDPILVTMPTAAEAEEAKPAAAASDAELLAPLSAIAPNGNGNGNGNGSHAVNRLS